MTPKNYTAVLSLDPTRDIALDVALRDRSFDMSVIDWTLKHKDGSIGPRPVLMVANMPNGIDASPVLIARHDTVEFKGEFLPSDVIEFNGMAIDPGESRVEFGYDASQCVYTFSDVSPDVAAKYAAIEMPTDAEIAAVACDEGPRRAQSGRVLAAASACHCNARGCPGCEQCEGCTCKPE